MQELCLVSIEAKNLDDFKLAQERFDQLKKRVFVDSEWKNAKMVGVRMMTHILGYTMMPTSNKILAIQAHACLPGEENPPKNFSAGMAMADGQFLVIMNGCRFYFPLDKKSD